MEGTFPKLRRSPVEINPEPASECSFGLLISLLQQLHASMATHGVALQVSCVAYFIKTVVRLSVHTCGTRMEHTSTSVYISQRSPLENLFLIPRLRRAG